HLMCPEVPTIDLPRNTNDSKPNTKSTKSSARSRPFSANNGKKQIPRPRPRTTDTQAANDVAIPTDIADFSLAKTISKIECKLEEGELPENTEDDVIPGISNEIGA
ncbi:testis-expressed protein 9-like, partial [Pyxicephalus adspersus]|uniref:testis-expressed protein 9-like n=1 Tax=Pyxicephalus adspersus TaxID=30357 RepID=UPI003B5B6AC9